jgi:hypothetical protein
MTIVRIGPVSRYGGAGRRTKRAAVEVDGASKNTEMGAMSSWKTARSWATARWKRSTRCGSSQSRLDPPRHWTFMGPMYFRAITTLSMYRCWSYGEGFVPP